MSCVAQQSTAHYTVWYAEPLNEPLLTQAWDVGIIVHLALGCCDVRDAVCLYRTAQSSEKRHNSTALTSRRRVLRHPPPVPRLARAALTWAQCTHPAPRNHPSEAVCCQTMPYGLQSSIFSHSSSPASPHQSSSSAMLSASVSPARV